MTVKEKFFEIKSQPDMCCNACALELAFALSEPYVQVFSMGKAIDKHLKVFFTFN
jgi:hypothetical protein